MRFDYMLKFINREIEKKKEELIPKRGDFFNVKVFRKNDNNTLNDKSSTFKFTK